MRPQKIKFEFHQDRNLVILPVKDGVCMQPNPEVNKPRGIGPNRHRDVTRCR